MALASKGGSKDYQTYFEIPIGWQDGDGTTAYNVLSDGYRFSPQDLGDHGDEGVLSEEQYTKLQWYFNLFEKFMLSGVKVEYKGRYNMITPNYITSTGAGTTVNTAPTPQVTADTTQYTPSYMNLKEFVMFRDDEDITTRDGATPGALDEFFQAKLQDGMVTCLSTGTTTLWIRPKYLDAISPDAISNAFPSPTTSIGTGATLPKEVEWMSTKVFEGADIGPPPVGTSPALNLFQEFLGMKWYLYDPYNTNVSTYTYYVGKLCFTYYWSFKDLDNRPLLTTVTMDSLMSEDQLAKRALLKMKHPAGHFYKRHPGSQKSDIGLKSRLAHAYDNLIATGASRKRSRVDPSTPSQVSKSSAPPQSSGNSLFQSLRAANGGSR